jgi:hypothetical protein
MLTPQPDQLPLPFALDTEALTAFVTAFLAITTSAYIKDIKE